MPREPAFKYVEAVDTSAPPAGVPDVPEVGATSAPLKSASFFIGARCRPYNDDFMQCKKDSDGSPADCLREGRRVTRCAVSVLEDINKHCLNEFRLHWQCLENANHELYACRPAERLLNKCVFANIGLEKRIPDAPVQIHEVEKPLLRPAFEDYNSVHAARSQQQQQQ